MIDFYSNDHIETDQLYSTDSKALEKANKFDKGNRLDVRTSSSNFSVDAIDESSSVAYPIEIVKNDTNLQKRLQQALLNGKKVYLYGDLCNAPQSQDTIFRGIS